VMTCANRAISAPLSIWNDQQDSMSVRDAGWVQLYCADNQEAADTTIQAYRIAERCELPVMVCVDGFTLTHTLESIDIPEQPQVDNFLPPFRFARALDPTQPLSLGTLVSPDFYPEARHAHHHGLLAAATEIVAADDDWAAISGRHCGGLLHVDGDAEAEVGILSLGSILGTLADARALHPELGPVKLLKLRAFRPFPVEALKQACAGLKQLIVVERALSLGGGGIVGPEVRAALAELAAPPRVHNFAVGLGGRDVPLDLYPRLLAALAEEQPVRFRILDVDLDKLPEEDQ
jgi:pyruvate ferredoxin oxidoreductase alpha subunit